MRKDIARASNLVPESDGIVHREMRHRSRDSRGIWAVGRDGNMLGVVDRAY